MNAKLNEHSIRLLIESRVTTVEGDSSLPFEELELAKHVCPICEDVYAQPGTFVVSIEGVSQEHEAWHCPECSYAFLAVGDAQKLATHAWSTSPRDRFSSELIKAGDGVVRRRP